MADAATHCSTFFGIRPESILGSALPRAAGVARENNYAEPHGNPRRSTVGKFRGTEVIRGNSNPSHVFRRFTMLLPHARGASKATLDSDAAAMTAIFKVSGEGKVVAGGGFG